MSAIWNVLVTAAFFLAFGALVLRWLGECGGTLPGAFSAPLPSRRGEPPRVKTLWTVFLCALVFRGGVALGSLLLYNALQGSGLGLAELPGLWARWDAPHYIKLVELGYDGYIENGRHLFLVFYPLYVWLTRAARLLIPNTAVAGMAVSWLCFGWGSAYLYRLGCEEYGQKTVRRALALLWCFPFSFFFGGIMTESLFLLTTAAGLYYIRKHQWGRFALWGALAAVTRMMGLILVGAAIAELCVQYRPLDKKGREQREAFWDILKRLPLMLVPVLGTLVYLGLNYSVTGDPFAFTEMQKHWSQGFMWLPKVLEYLARNAFAYPSLTIRWEMWIPELILFPIFAILIGRSWKKHRSMFILYAFVYLILNYCLSWLLSAGRYLSCALPCAFFAAEALEGKEKWAAVLCALMMVLQAVFLYRYFCWGQVM